MRLKLMISFIFIRTYREKEISQTYITNYKKYNNIVML